MVEDVCTICKLPFWTMRPGESPAEMIKRDKDNPGQYCKKHRVTRAVVEEKIKEMAKWHPLNEDEDDIVVNEEGLYEYRGENYSRSIIDGLPRD